MRRLLLLGATVLLFGCAAPTQPQAEAPSAPRLTPARILHRLVLTTPPGSQGVIELRRESELKDGGEVFVYRAYGGLVVADDLAQWRFAYTKTSLEGAGPNPGEWINGLHALSMIFTNITSGELVLDWERSTFVDASGRPQRMVHRGIQLNQKASPMVPATVASGAIVNEFVFPGEGLRFTPPGAATGGASVWNSPAIFERLAPGAEFLMILSLRTGQTATQRQFKFSAVAPPPPAPAPAAPR